MKTHVLVLLLIAFIGRASYAQQNPENQPLVKGFAIAAPKPDGLADFIQFIHHELAPREVNTLILRVDFNYAYTSHPELRDSITLSESNVKEIVAACRQHGIQVIPQLNLLGHQSWADELGNLLAVYPEFDETPWVQMPAKGTYEWPNDDGLYCKSYCPLHPGVHQVVFALVDELMEVFEAKAFHAGMDEVFYLGESKCPRCAGRDKSVLFANEVQTIRDHLAARGWELWIWGDRLIDGYTTGIGMWAASHNDTHRAIDLIPRDVVICDWQYSRDNQTAAYFALKGLRVVTCAWDHPEVAVSQANNLFQSRAISNEELRGRYYGIAHTVWSGPAPFFKGFREQTPDDNGGTNTPWHTFRVLFDEIAELEK